jgi:hypothetical protein
MSRTITRAGITGLALGLTASLGLLSTGVAAEDLPHTTLAGADGSGVPAGFTAEQWTAAQGEARVVARENGQDVIEFEASGLVPEGLYTFWWVNRGLIGMDMGPGGGVPENEFTADAEGNAATTIRAPSDNDYQMMVVAYHADDQTHGESPGEMGTETFEHLRGPWPGPAGELPN